MSLLLQFYRALARRVMPGEWESDLDAMTAVFGEALEDAKVHHGFSGVFATTAREMLSVVRVATNERRVPRRQRLPSQPHTSRKSEIMHEMLRDIRYAIRGIIHAPIFAIVVVTTLGLGIGANTAIFSVVNGVLLRPLPYNEPEALVRGFTRFPSLGFSEFWVSWGQYNILRERNDVFDELAVYGHTGSQNLSGIANPVQIRITPITHTLLPTLGVSPLFGRNFSEIEDQPNASTVVLLSHGLWQRQFGGDRNVLGQTIQLNGTSREVVGVLPASFRLPSEFGDPQAAEAWIPMAREYSTQPGSGSQNFNLVARLRPNEDYSAADRGVRETMEYIQAEFGWPEGFSGFAVPLHETVVGDVRPALVVLLATVGFVLLIACSNVANLMLARGESRGREIAVRVALGAGRFRLIRQFLSESLLFSALGGVAAVALAHLGVKALVTIDPTSVPRADTITTDLSVLGFTAALALATGIVFGILPATRARADDVNETLKEGTRGSTRGSGLKLGRVLAITEVALAVVLAIGAGLLAKSFWKLRSIDSGLNPTSVLTLNTSVPAASYPEASDVTQFYERLQAAIVGLPGVTRVGLASQLPIGGNHFDWTFRIEGREVPPGQSGPNADYVLVDTDYFQTMGIPVIRGRSFTEFDRDSINPVVVINQTMADQFWPEDDAMGQRITLFGDPVWHEIVGIVGDVRSRGLVEATRPEMFLEQRQMRALGANFRSLNLVVQAVSDPTTLVPALQNVFRGLDPDLPFAQVQTMEDIVSTSLSQERFSMLLLGVLAALALSLAAVGIYGVMSYNVAQRTQEIGIRMALGADKQRVRRLIVRQGMLTTTIGLGIGMVLALALTRGMQSLLFDVSAVDPMIYLGVAGLVVIVAWLSNFLPALRASRGNPIATLRAD